MQSLGHFFGSLWRLWFCQHYIISGAVNRGDLLLHSRTCHFILRDGVSNFSESLTFELNSQINTLLPSLLQIHGCALLGQRHLATELADPRRNVPDFEC